MIFSVKILIFSVKITNFSMKISDFFYEKSEWFLLWFSEWFIKSLKLKFLRVVAILSVQTWLEPAEVNFIFPSWHQPADVIFFSKFDISRMMSTYLFKSWLQPADVKFNFPQANIYLCSNFSVFCVLTLAGWSRPFFDISHPAYPG